MRPFAHKNEMSCITAAREKIHRQALREGNESLARVNLSRSWEVVLRPQRRTYLVRNRLFAFEQCKQLGTIEPHGRTILPRRMAVGRDPLGYDRHAAGAKGCKDQRSVALVLQIRRGQGGCRHHGGGSQQE
jgi:hypothetical protein